MTGQFTPSGALTSNCPVWKWRLLVESMKDVSLICLAQPSPTINHGHHSTSRRCKSGSCYHGNEYGVYIPIYPLLHWNSVVEGNALVSPEYIAKEGKGVGTIDFLVPAKGCIKIRSKIQEHMERFNPGRFDLYALSEPAWSHRNETDKGTLLRLGHPSGMAQKQVLNPSNLWLPVFWFRWYYRLIISNTMKEHVVLNFTLSAPKNPTLVCAHHLVIWPVFSLKILQSTTTFTICLHKQICVKIICGKDLGSLQSFTLSENNNRLV